MARENNFPARRLLRRNRRLFGLSEPSGIPEGMRHSDPATENRRPRKTRGMANTRPRPSRPPSARSRRVKGQPEPVPLPAQRKPDMPPRGREWASIIGRVLAPSAGNAVWQLLKHFWIDN